MSETSEVRMRETGGVRTSQGEVRMRENGEVKLE